MFQGWTGVGDTLLHSNILAYVILMARRSHDKILEMNESAMTLTLIDDAIT